jgi:hypothetical protein
MQTNNNAKQQQQQLTKLQQNAIVRMQQRIAVAQATRKQHQTARIAAREAAQQALANAQAYQLALQQLQAQYGVTAPQHAAPRANSATTQPSATVITINGVQYTPCKAVHALCVLHNGVRKAVLAACKQHGINPSTAATQYGVWRKSNVQ